jgi:hypothetical protein
VTAVSEISRRCAELVLLSRSGCTLTPKIAFAAGFLLCFLLQKSTSAGGSIFSVSKSRPSYSYWILCCRGCLTATVLLYKFPFFCFLCCVLGLIKLLVDFACPFQTASCFGIPDSSLAVSRPHSGLREYFCCWTQCSVCVSHQLRLPAGSSRAADFPLPSH